ncbi:MAG: TraR/DksA family transcriptional regulator [Paracoccaceae bacterium]
MDLERREALRQRLLAMKAEIEALGAQNDTDRRTVELDQQSVGRLSRMDALQVQAMAQETRRRRQRELARIATALALIEEGEFGWCRKCGEAISDARLEIDPAAPLCVDCAR